MHLHGLAEWNHIEFYMFYVIFKMMSAMITKL